jgi:hypothetical protein
MIFIFLKKKQGVFLKNLRWVGHPMLRPFKKKHGVFLKILTRVGHPILRPLFRKSGIFLKKFKIGRSSDMETIS